MSAVTSTGAPRSIGRYLLFAEIASGGMATVHIGKLSGPVGFSRTVAIKRLHPQYAKDPEFVTMFLDEARLAGRIRHPNVVPTLDVVTTEGEIFLVMEYVQGESLSKLARAASTRGVPMPPKVAATIVTNLLHGLHAAHETRDEHGRPLGIVHRDVSPQNVLVGGDGVARVLDFGVAKAAGRMQTTREGQIKGKLSYMAPEQLSGGTVTRAADIYAAGVVLWEALVGRRLFEGDNEAMVLVKVLEGRYERASHARPDVPPEVDAIIDKALARDPSHRYGSAREMALAIERSLGVASPAAVGEWVELVAMPELSRRAAMLAEVESAAALPPSSGPVSVGGFTGAPISQPISQPAISSKNEPSSQVSSISVSRPALRPSDVPLAAHKPTGLIAAVAGVAALGVVLLGLGLFVIPRVRGGAGEAVAHREPAAAPDSGARELEPEVRGFVPQKATAAPPPVQVQGVGNVVRPPPPPPSNECNPPYTIDPATGRKKYKMQCLKN